METEFGKRADMQAYLFEDYYSDNIMKFLLNRYERKNTLKVCKETEKEKAMIMRRNQEEMVLIIKIMLK